MTWTFHLRDAKWEDGVDVKAGDFEYAIKRILNPETASPISGNILFIKNAEEAVAGSVGIDEVGVKALDDKTLEIQLAYPAPYFLSSCAGSSMLPMRQDIVEANGDSYGTEADKIVGNGPFSLKEWVHNSKISYVKNPSYWNADAVKLEELTMKIITDGQAALTSLMSGELDYTDLTTGELVTQAEANGYEVTSYSDGASFYMMVNCENQFLSNVNLRRALALGFDKQALIDTVFQNENMPMTSFTAPAVNGYDGTSFQAALNAKDGDLYPANGDVTQAQEYLNTALEELGITLDELNGQLSIDCGDSSSSQAEAAFYQEQWRQNLGLEVTINPMITKQGADNRQNGNYCLSITGWSPDYNDPMTFLDMWVTDGGNNDTRWGSEEYDALIDSATNETEDLAARQEYFYQAEEILADQYIILPSYWRSASYTYNTNKILGGLRNTTFQTNFTYVELAA